MCKCECTIYAFTIIQVWECSNVWIFKCIRVRTFKYTNILNVQMHGRILVEPLSSSNRVRSSIVDCYFVTHYRCSLLVSSRVEMVHGWAKHYHECTNVNVPTMPLPALGSAGVIHRVWILSFLGWSVSTFCWNIGLGTTLVVVDSSSSSTPLFRLFPSLFPFIHNYYTNGI